jgi:hypothetical protein
VISVDGRNIVSGQQSWLKNSERMYILEPYASYEYAGWRSGQVPATVAAKIPPPKPWPSTRNSDRLRLSSSSMNGAAPSVAAELSTAIDRI